MADVLRILLVDDDQDEYILTRELLSDCAFRSDRTGYERMELDWVGTYQQALEAIARQEHDVYLVDYRLGRRDGLALLREVRKQEADGCFARKAPIILFTGQGSYDVDIEAMQAGASDYLVKEEVTAPLLERTIRYALERQRAEEALCKARDELEVRVRERTQELDQAINELRSEMSRRQQIQTELQLERLHLFSLLEQLPAFVYLQAPDYTIRFTNGQFKQIFGEADGKPCYQVIHKLDHPCPACPSFQVFETNQPVQWEWSLPGGASFQIHNYPFTDVDGSPLILALGIDISQRKQAEAELERNYEELHLLSVAEHRQRLLTEALVQATAALNSSLNPDEVLDCILEQTQRVIPCEAVVILLMEGETMRVARQRGFEAHVSSYPPISSEMAVADYPLLQKVITSRQPVVVADTWLEPEWKNAPGLDWVRSAALAPLLAGEQGVGFLVIFSAETDFFDLEIVGMKELLLGEAPLMPGEGSFSPLTAFAAHAVMAIQNANLYKELAFACDQSRIALEQEQRLRSQLVQSEKFAAMGRMVASVAHELNNPLQIIKNCLFLTEHEAPQDAPFQEYLSIASSETQRLSNLVTQLRELYRSKSLLQMRPLDLAAVLEEVHCLLAPMALRQNVRWKQAAASGALVNGSPDQLVQVFLNICSNSIEAMQPEGGEMTVTLLSGKDESQLGVQVRDTGTGISAENLPKLFEPFFTTKPQGLGLGLSICFEIIERHSGRITVESSPGEGSSFTVWLPVYTGNQTSNAQ